MHTLVRPFRLQPAFDDPGAVRQLVEARGPYPSISSYLPASATRDASDQEGGAQRTLPWFRGNWAVNGSVVVDGAEIILHNERFAAAASQLFDGAAVRPTTVVVNVNAPMPAGATHVDIPSFRGATRERFALPLLQAMGASALFEPWRVVEAGVITWFYDGPGGTYDYWPDGLDGEMRSEGPPFHNVALVADNDRMFHRIGAVGEPQAADRTFAASATIAKRAEGGWAVSSDGHEVASYRDGEIRISVLWKAEVIDGPHVSSRDDLSADDVVSTFQRDLDRRGVDVDTPADALSDPGWVDRVHAVYYTPR